MKGKNDFQNFDIDTYFLKISCFFEYKMELPHNTCVNLLEKKTNVTYY